jgi:hypothetical protein
VRRVSCGAVPDSRYGANYWLMTPIYESCLGVEAMGALRLETGGRHRVSAT